MPNYESFSTITPNYYPEQKRNIHINALPSLLNAYFCVSPNYDTDISPSTIESYDAILHCQTCYETSYKEYKRKPKKMTCPTCKTHATLCLSQEDYYITVYKASISSGYTMTPTDDEYASFTLQFATHEIQYDDIKTHNYTVELRLTKRHAKPPILYMRVNSKPIRNITYGTLPYFMPEFLCMLLDHDEIKPRYHYFVQKVFQTLKRTWYPSYSLPSLPYLGLFIAYPTLLNAPPEFVKEWLDNYINVIPSDAETSYQPQYERPPNLRFDPAVKKRLQTNPTTFRHLLNMYGWHETSEDVAHFMKQHPDVGDLYRLVTYLFKDQANQLRVLTYLTSEFDAEKSRVLKADGEEAWLKQKRKIQEQLYYFYLCASYKWATISETTYRYRTHSMYNAYTAEDDWENYPLYIITPPKIHLRPHEDGDCQRHVGVQDYIQSETQTTLKRATSHLSDAQLDELTYLTYNSLKPYNRALNVLYPNVFYRKGATIYNKAQGLTTYFQEHEDVLADYLTDTFAQKATYIEKLIAQTTFIAELIHMYDLVVYHELNPYVTFDADLGSTDIYAFHRELYCRAMAYTANKVKRDIQPTATTEWRIPLNENTNHFNAFNDTNVNYGLSSIQYELNPLQMVATTRFNPDLLPSFIADNIRALRLVLAPYEPELYARHHRVNKNGYTSYIIESVDDLIKCVLRTKKYDRKLLTTFVKHFTKTNKYLYTCLICNQTGQTVAVGEWHRLNKNSRIAHFIVGIYHKSIQGCGANLMITSVRN